MVRTPSIRSTVFEGKVKYDAFLCALGFESRAAYVPSSVEWDANRRYAFGFKDRQTLAYQENVTRLEALGFVLRTVSDEEFRSDILGILSEISSAERIRIAIDISCFNRVRIATLVDVFRSGEIGPREVHVDFFYCLAMFSPPSTSRTANTHVSPVIPQFAGWSVDPGLPPFGVVGLGYEQNKALGALEYLQITKPIVFIPQSSIAEYETEVRSANESLLAQLDARNILTYRVEDPVATFITIESLLGGTTGRFNPVLLPFGPKIFFVLSVLAACVHVDTAVWRVSAGSADEPSDREPSDSVVSFSAIFAPTVVREAG